MYACKGASGFHWDTWIGEGSGGEQWGLLATSSFVGFLGISADMHHCCGGLLLVSSSVLH